MLGLKRGAAKGNHAGNIRSIVEEMGEERFSTSSTLDRSRSDQNIYFGNYRSGRECVEAMLAEIDEYEIEYKKTSYRNRGLRADATVAVAFIVKPEADWINNQTPEDVEKFFEDAHEVLTDLKITSPESERMRVRHLDEGSVHEHYCTLAYDSEGKLRGSKIVNLKTFRKLNQEFPEMMQKRGWDMNELIAYDPEEVKDMTPDEAAAYKQEHIEKKKQKRHGLTTNEYIAEKEAEKLAEIQTEIADLPITSALVKILPLVSSIPSPSMVKLLFTFKPLTFKYGESILYAPSMYLRTSTLFCPRYNCLHQISPLIISSGVVVRELNTLGRSARIIDGPDGAITPGERRIAVRKGSTLENGSYDYHFMVQNADGTWSEKKGGAGPYDQQEGNPKEEPWNMNVPGIVFTSMEIGYGTQPGDISQAEAEAKINNGYYDSEIVYIAIS